MRSLCFISVLALTVPLATATVGMRKTMSSPDFAASLKESFEINYKNVVARLSSIPDASVFYFPDKTAPPNSSALPESCLPPAPGAEPSCGFQWGASTGWRSGFYPGLLWQLANETGDDEFLVLSFLVFFYVYAQSGGWCFLQLPSLLSFCN